jgi:ABC-type transport system involved in multi-copper enzyme maturation permease subunit
MMESASPWGVRVRQLRAIVRLELRKSLRGKRAAPTYLLALVPLPIFVLPALFPMEGWVEDGLGNASRIFGVIFQTFILQVIFFGCISVFSNLFRGEMLDRCLHFYLLSPIRRETLVVGKYLSGLLSAILLFGSTVVLCNLLLYVPFGIGVASEYFFSGPGFVDLITYLFVTALACLGYGSVFLILGLMFRNPIVPGIAVLGWELINFLLPPFLTKISVIHYLKGLLPVPMSEGPFAILAQAPPAWLSFFGLLAFTAAVLVLAGWRLRRLEIRYSD